MANPVLQLQITAQDAASPEITRLTSALEELGVETQVIADGMAESERKAVGAFGEIADSAHSTGEMIERSLVAALNRIESPQGIQELQRELTRLQNSGRLSAEEMERLRDAQERLDRLAYAAGQSEAALTQELQRQRQAAQAAAEAADELGDATGRSSREFQDHRESAGGLSDALKGVAEKFGVSGEAFDLLSGKLAKGEAIGLLAAQFVEANREADRLAKQFRAMTGDTETAAQEIDFLRTVADRWGTSVFELSPAYLRLTAAVKGTTAEGEPARKMIDDLSAAYINAGQNIDEMGEAMEIVGEAFANGRVSIDDLREGMQEDMPPAIQAATTAILDNNEALKKMLETGDAAADEFMPAFAAALREHIGGSQEQINTTAAAFARLSAQIKDLYTDVDDQVPLMKAYDGVLQGWIKTVETLVVGLGLLKDGLFFSAEAVGTAAAALANGDDVMAALADQSEKTGASIERTALHLVGLKTATEEAAERQKQMQAELQAIQDQSEPYQAAIRQVNQSLEDAQEEFAKTGDAAALTSAALETFLKIPEKRLNTDGVYELAAALKVVGDNAEDSGQQISDTLGKELSKLTDDQLTRLEAQARAALAAASEGSEESRQAFAELGQVVEGVVLARLERLGVDGPEALRGISDAADEAIADFTALAEHSELSADTIEAAFDGVLNKLDNPEELESFKQKILELGEDGKLTGEQVERALLLIRQRIQEVATDSAFAALEQALARIREETTHGIEVGEQERASLQTRIQSAIELAKAKGDEAEAARLSAVATQEELSAAQARIQQYARQQTEIDGHIQKLYAQAQADGVYTDAERKAIEALQDKAAALGRDKAELEARLPLLQREADQAEKMAGPIGKLIDLYEKKTAVAGRETDAIDRSYDSKIRDLQVEQDQAEAKGDLTRAAELAVDIKKAEAEQAQAVADATRDELQAQIDLIEAKKQAIDVEERATEAGKERLAQMDEEIAKLRDAIDASQDHADSLKAEADALDDLNNGLSDGTENLYLFGQGADDVAKRLKKMNEEAKEGEKQREQEAKAQGSYISNIYNGWIDRLSALSESAANAFKTMQGGASEVEKFMARATDATYLMKVATDGINAGGVVGQLNRMAVKALEVEMSFKGQAAAADRVIESLERIAQEGGTQSALGALARQAENAKTSFELLDQERLDHLAAAIDAANDKLQRMQEETQSAKDRLAELNAELLEAQGADEKAQLLRQQLDYQQQLADIEYQRNEAELTGNRELINTLNQQQAILEKINQTKVANIQAEAQAAQAAERTATATANLASQADHIERIAGAMRTMSGVDISHIATQAGVLSGHLAAINEVL